MTVIQAPTGNKSSATARSPKHAGDIAAVLTSIQEGTSWACEDIDKLIQDRKKQSESDGDLAGAHMWNLLGHDVFQLKVTTYQLVNDLLDAHNKAATHDLVRKVAEINDLARSIVSFD